MISDHSTHALVNDTLKFTDVNAYDVVFSQNATKDLVITLSNGDTVTITNHFSDVGWDMEQIEFADGTILGLQDIRDKSVSDMKATGAVGGSRYVENYEHTSGDGSYTITDFSGDLNTKDTLTFTDVNAADVTFAQNAGKDLVITLSNGETVTIVDHFKSWQWGLEQVEFADGTVLNVQDIRDKALTGGSGDDTLIGFSSDDVLDGRAGNDTIYGGAGDDIIDGGDGDDNHYGEGGNDLILGSIGADFFDGGDGIDTIDFSFSGNNFNLSLAASNVVFSDGFTEQVLNFENIVGGAGNNVLTGSDVANAIDGGVGNDRIVGLEGDDTLTGGSGADVFVFNTLATEGADNITDFELDVDIIELAGSTYTDLSLIDTGSGTRVEWANGSVEIENVSIVSLTEDQFAFV